MTLLNCFRRSFKITFPLQAGGAGPNLNAGVVLLTTRRPPPPHHQAADEADEDKDAKATGKAAEQEESDFVLVFHLVDLATTATASSHHLGRPLLRLKNIAHVISLLVAVQKVETFEDTFYPKMQKW